MCALFQHPFIFGKTTKQKYHASSLTAVSFLEKLLKIGSRFKKKNSPYCRQLVKSTSYGCFFVNLCESFVCFNGLALCEPIIQCLYVFYLISRPIWKMCGHFQTFSHNSDFFIWIHVYISQFEFSSWPPCESLNYVCITSVSNYTVVFGRAHFL